MKPLRLAMLFIGVAIFTMSGCASGDKIVTKEETYPDGKLKSRVEYRIRDGNEVLWGKAIYFYDNGAVELQCEYANGKRHGKYEAFHPNGNPKETGEFAYGLREGEWTEWDIEGGMKKRTFKAGEEVKQ